ncbi:unnamed protein product [Coregonus sp. 'balchen']|nr:unnamed protein product [Coregonus sp. 'balchen']
MKAEPARLRQGRDVCSSASGGHQRSQTEVGTSSANGSTKPRVTGSRPHQPSTAVSSRLPYKSQGVPRSIPSKASVHNEHSGSTGNVQVSAGAAQGCVGRPASSKTTVLKAGCKTTASTNQVPSRSRASTLKRTASSRLLRPAAVLPVDKNRPRATPRSHPQPQQRSPVPSPPQSNRHPDLVLAEGRAAGTESYRAPCERKNQSPQQLQGLLAASNRKFEAIVVVLQQTLAERDEVIKQRRDLSQELMTLQKDSLYLEQEVESLNVVLDIKNKQLHQQDHKLMQMDTLTTAVLQEYLHKESKVNKRLSMENEELIWKLHNGDPSSPHKMSSPGVCGKTSLIQDHSVKSRMQNYSVDQSGALKVQSQHSEKNCFIKTSSSCRCITCGQEQTEGDTTEPPTASTASNRHPDLVLAEGRAAGTESYRAPCERKNQSPQQLQGLLAASNRKFEAIVVVLQQTLAERDEVIKQRRDLSQELMTLQKDSLYLEQEVESLNVVLDIKNKQLHQQDHKLMQMDTLTTAVLQEYLHKESKVNKRLSMENEELIWKLHNGDPSSPHKMSPTSPSHHSLGLQSPRSSAVFTSPIQSPRSSAVFSSPPVSPR